MKKFMMVLFLLGMNYMASVHFNDYQKNNTFRAPASQIEKITQRKQWAFNYKDLSKKPFSIKKEATSYEEAYKAASRECYQMLTDGKYPGEEKGLDIIDICANPKS